MEQGTVGRSPERKEEALRYRLQIAAFTRAVADELEGVRTMVWLRGIAATAGTMLSQEGGQVGRVVREVSGTLRATHMEGQDRRIFRTASEGRERRCAG